ncbi:MAG: DUF502 domain-containing protein [Patescibacteria group bacterium]|nr:DUF502 domain-containing protein [Patescibacteria group bacterium]
MNENTKINMQDFPEVQRFLNAVTKVIRYFFSGIVIVLPLILTLAVVGWVIGFFDGLIGGQSFLNNIVNFILSITTLGTEWKTAIGYSLIVGALILLGAFRERKALGTRVQLRIQNFFSRIPLVSKIYSTSEQISEYFLKPSDGLSKFGDVVMIDVMNGKMFGLVSPESILDIGGVKHMWVFIPTAPVPATGYNYLAKLDSVYSCKEIGIDNFAKANISLGILAHDLVKEQLNLVPYSEVLAERKKDKSEKK